MTVKWVVRWIKVRDHKENNEVRVRSFDDEADAAEQYGRLLKEFASDFPQDVRQVDLYLETQWPGVQERHRGPTIVRHHVVTSNGHGRGTPNAGGTGVTEYAWKPHSQWFPDWQIRSSRE